MDAALGGRDGSTTVDLRVVTGAPHTAFPAGYDEWRDRVVVKVSAEPRDGAANRELLEAAAGFFEVNGGDVRIVRGHRSDRKTLEVRLPPEEAASALEHGLERQD